MSADPSAGSRTDQPVELVASLVERAALDGSTCLPAAAVAAALRGRGVGSPEAVEEAALRAGLVAACPEDGALGHPRWAPLEEQVAERCARLLTRAGGDAVGVVDTPRGSRPPRPDAQTLVVEQAHRLGLADAALLLERLAGSQAPQRLRLAGDPAMPYAPGPGRVLADLVSSGVVAVEAAGPDPEAGGDQLCELVRSLRRGRLPALDPTRHDVVVTAAADAEQAVRRVLQLVCSSVPRGFGTAASDVLVLAPRHDGAAGVDALSAALDAAGAGAVRTATAAEGHTAEAEAVVLVLPAESAGTITRSMLVGAATQAGRHLSVVHQAGPALAEAVARRTHPPRRTRLSKLLADALA